MPKHARRKIKKYAKKKIGYLKEKRLRRR